MAGCLQADVKSPKPKSARDKINLAVQGTNDSSIVSKCSMASVGYFDDEFLKFFVAKFRRRSPLIHRGYYIRCQAIDYAIQQFLFCGQDRKLQIINLGVGFDSTYFRLKAKGQLTNTVFFEVDYPDLVKRKHALIDHHAELSQLFDATDDWTTDDPTIEIMTKDYRLLGVDLKKLCQLEAVLMRSGYDPHCTTLIITEVCLTYINRKFCDAIIQWAAETFAQAVFLMYEQITPDDAFGRFMQKHYHHIGSPLKCLNHYPTLQSQVNRFLDHSWEHCEAMDMNEYYTTLVSDEEKRRISNLEYFDEFEEFHLKCSHYFILCAYKGTKVKLFSEKTRQRSLSFVKERSRMNLPMSSNRVIFPQPSYIPSTVSADTSVFVSCFGHSSARLGDMAVTIGGFGHVSGRHRRLARVAVTNLRHPGDTVIVSLEDDTDATILVDRMYHSVVPLRDGALLVIGGRTSPKHLGHDLLIYQNIPDFWPSCEPNISMHESTVPLMRSANDVHSNPDGSVSMHCNCDKMSQSNVLMQQTCSGLPILPEVLCTDCAVQKNSVCHGNINNNNEHEPWTDDLQTIDPVLCASDIYVPEHCSCRTNVLTYIPVKSGIESCKQSACTPDASGVLFGEFQTNSVAFQNINDLEEPSTIKTSNIDIDRETSQASTGLLACDGTISMEVGDTLPNNNTGFSLSTHVRNPNATVLEHSDRIHSGNLCEDVVLYTHEGDQDSASTKDDDASLRMNSHDSDKIHHDTVIKGKWSASKKTCHTRPSKKAQGYRSKKTGSEISKERHCATAKEALICRRASSCFRGHADVRIRCRVVEQHGDIPGARWRHSATIYTDEQTGAEKVYLFGGRTQSELALGDCYCLDVTSYTWEKILGKGTPPEPRLSHSACIWNKQLVIMGGLTGAGHPVNSVFMLDLQSHQWTQLEIQGKLFTRYSHTASVLENKLILLGGVTFDPHDPGIAIIDLLTGRCHEYSLPCTDGDSNDIMMYHGHSSFILDRSCICVLGGGGNCFSFGTHLNATPRYLDITSCLRHCDAAWKDV